MKILHKFRFAISYGLRITHIALWMTIPTWLWLWLVGAPEPSPRSCEPICGWYQGNVLGMSEDAHFWISFGLFLPGFLSLSCWITGYFLEAVGRSMRGDKMFPSVRLILIGPGCGLIWSSFRFWLPAIAYLIVITVLASTLPLATRNHSFHALLMIGAPIMLMMYWGYLVGLARFAASGEHRLLYRRRENMRLALTNISAAISLTFLLIVTTIGSAVVLAASEFLVLPLRDLDFMTRTALATLYFFVVLLTWSIVCSRIVARYAAEIGIVDNLNLGANLDKMRPSMR